MTSKEHFWRNIEDLQIIEDKINRVGAALSKYVYSILKCNTLNLRCSNCAVGMPHSAFHTSAAL